jgi:hypothetical protein
MDVSRFGYGETVFPNVTKSVGQYLIMYQFPGNNIENSLRRVASDLVSEWRSGDKPRD